MKGDFSRETFSPRKHYSAVLMQQGRVQLDADWNEQQAIHQHRIETVTRNLIGLSGGPADNAGFEISVQDDTLRIGSGDYYVDGMLCQNEDTILFGDQDDLPGMTITRLLSPKDEPNSVGLVYLDVWERHVTAVEDDRIREVALGGPDTTTRKRTVCQVKARRLDAADTTSNVSELQPLVKEHRDLANKLEVAALAAPADELHELRTQLQLVRDRILELVKVDRHHSFDEELNAIHPPSTGKLLVDTNGSPSTNGSPNSKAPHLLPPGAGYELLENQLYRVEIHTGGEPGVATFKWSRDNGSVVTSVLKLPYAETGDSPTTEIEVRDLGNDETLGFAPGEYVELMSDDRELSGQTGPILRIVEVSPAKRTITVGAKLAPIKPDDVRAFHYKLRRWDYPPDQEMPPDGMKIPLNEEPVDLEGGIRVRFSAGHYNAGDYWLIPARTATGDIEWPGNEFRPPAGIEHHYSPLALAMLGTFTEGRGTKKHLLVLSDCRDQFPPLTGMTGLFYLGGDGQSALPLRELPEPLVVGVAAGGRPMQGARVKFEVQAKDLASYDGHLAVDSAATEDGGAVKSLIATTDARGEARCFWTLAKEIPSQQVKASLVDGTHLPVYFNANLSAVGETAVDIVQIDKVLLGTQELGIDTAVPATALADSAIRVICDTDRLSPKFRARSDCYVTMEMPFPQNTADRQLWGNNLIGFQPLVLAAGVNVDENEIEWTPSAVTRTWLKNALFSNVQAPDDQILTRFTLKGNFAFPSGGDGRAGDFEMPFRVVEDQVRLNSIALDPNAVIGQTSPVKGTVNLVGPAPAGGVRINLRSSNANVASVPSAPVTIDAGKTSSTFQVSTTAVATAATVEITATTQDQQQAVSTKLVVQPPVLENLMANPSTLFGKSSAGGTVTLTGPAPGGGASVVLSSGNPAIVKVPSSVNVAAGSRTNATPFTIETEPINSASPVAITASYNGNRQVTLTVQPPVLNSLTLTASSVTGGTSQVSGRVNLNAPAPAGYTVALRSTDASAATVPENISIPQNATSQDFSVTTKPVASRSDLNIVATRGGVERSAPLAVQPPTLTNFVFSPTRVPNAGSSTGTITLSGPAPSNTVANLAASNDATVTLPTTIPVTAGANQITFEASGRAFTDPERSVTVTAFYLGATRPANLTVEGRIVPSSLTVSPSTVIGRTTTAQGTVTLTGPAPAGGLSVALSSANAAIATVPTSVNVPAGSTTAQFQVNTEPVSSSAPVTITASSQGVQQTATLTVQPPKLAGFSFSPPQIGGGATSTATITLSGPAPSGTSITLGRSNTTTADFPSSVAVPPNATQVTFAAIGRSGNVIVTASYLGSELHATLTAIVIKTKEKEKDTKEKEKDTKEREKVNLKIEKEKEDDMFDVRPRATDESDVEEPGAEESASERSFIQPEERPEPGQQATEESDEEE